MKHGLASRWSRLTHCRARPIAHWYGFLSGDCKQVSRLAVADTRSLAHRVDLIHSVLSRTRSALDRQYEWTAVGASLVEEEVSVISGIALGQVE
jgi:hypothetical protein